MSVRESILELQPYKGGMHISVLERKLGLTNIVKLASNENPQPVSKIVSAAISAAICDIGRYPDGDCFALKKSLSAHLDIDSACITVGNGSNDILEFTLVISIPPV